MNWNAYWRLARFNKPAGILLLWYPTAWALWCANKGAPPLRLFVLFLIGTILMRSAGCVINDYADRDIDKHVARTKLRPLTSGEISLRGAAIFLFALLLAALLVLIHLPVTCIYLACFALLITVIYPFCKRFINAPQLVLGLAFSMGIPMAYLASGAVFDTKFFLLFALNFLWIVAYDTMYAMTDREDDVLIGVKSTAVYFGKYDRLAIALLQSTMHLLWLFLGWTHSAPLSFYLCWSAGLALLAYQQKLINTQIPKHCFKAFLISVYYGLLMWIAVIVLSVNAH